KELFTPDDNVGFRGLYHHTCGPSVRFFLTKLTGFLLIFFPRQTSHSCDARNKEEYVPARSPTAKAIANPVIDWAPRNRNARTASIVVTVVLILRVIVCTRLRLTILASSLNDLTRFFFLRFSRIRSNVTMVSLMEYPIIVSIAATMVTSNSICARLNIANMKKASWSSAMMAVTPKNSS